MHEPFDALSHAMRDAMDERRMRLETARVLRRALSVLARFEYGGDGRCMECASLPAHGHTGSCEIGLLLQLKQCK